MKREEEEEIKTKQNKILKNNLEEFNVLKDLM